MLELEEAQQRIQAAVTGGAMEMSPLCLAGGRFCAADVISAIDLPPFDNSAMDGYAVRAAELATATPASPVWLRQIGRVAAGHTFSSDVIPGSCVRVLTGSAVPAGADTVIMQEETFTDPSDLDRVAMTGIARPWENIRFRGEDLKQGEILIHAGERLSIGLLGLLAAAGIAAVNVGRQPTLGLLATGDELQEPGHPLQPGQIYESNRISLASLASAAGARPVVYPLVSDSLPEITSALLKALRECDAVVTSGGMSVGELDFVKAAWRDLGAELDFWQVAIKPGKPFGFGRCQGKLIFGLPGNPISALVTFLLLVRPALLKFQGAAKTGLRPARATLAEALHNDGNRRHFFRVQRDDIGNVRPAGIQASHLLRSFAQADGLVDVPPQTTLPAGTAVSVLEWR